MSEDVGLVIFAVGFVGVAAFLVIGFTAFAMVDRIVARVHSQHRDAWEQAGRPMGAWHVPQGAERSVESYVRGLRAIKAWAQAADGPLADDAALVSLLRRHRTLVRWSIVVWAMTVAGVLAVAAASR